MRSPLEPRTTQGQSRTASVFRERRPPQGDRHAKARRGTFSSAGLLLRRCGRWPPLPGRASVRWAAGRAAPQPGRCVGAVAAMESLPAVARDEVRAEGCVDCVRWSREPIRRPSAAAAARSAVASSAGPRDTIGAPSLCLTGSSPAGASQPGAPTVAAAWPGRDKGAGATTVGPSASPRRSVCWAPCRRAPRATSNEPIDIR